MTPLEMLDHCKKQQELTGSRNAAVVFKVPGNWGKSRKKRLFPGGPIGTIVGQEVKGTVIVSYKADEVISAIENKL